MSAFDEEDLKGSNTMCRMGITLYISVRDFAELQQYPEFQFVELYSNSVEAAKIVQNARTNSRTK